MNNNKPLSSEPNKTDSPTAPVITDEYRKLHVRPFIRFFAKLLDIYLFAFIVGFFSVLLYPAFINMNTAITSIIILFLWICIEPFFLITFGITLGRYLLLIALRDANGNKLNYKTAYKRGFMVWGAGLGFGIPLLNIITLYLSYAKLNSTGSTLWDEKNNLTVTHGSINYVRGITAGVLIAIFFSLSLLGSFEDYRTDRMRNSPSYYASQIEKQNKDLPVMIDSETEFTKMVFENDTLYYHYRLVNTPTTKVNKEKFHDFMHKQIIEHACNKSEPNETLSLGYNLSFNYVDKAGEPLTTILITPSDCH